MSDFLLSCHNLLIAGHHDPDADCIGAILGLYHVFGGARLGWLPVLEDDIPQNLYYLPGRELILRPAQLRAQPAAVLLVDCGAARRASRGWLDAYVHLPHYCIDHHSSNDFQGELAVVEPQASSSGEIVAAISMEAGLPINSEAAICLYSAIVDDTGCFRYQNTTPRALSMAAKMLEQGVDKEQVRIQLFESRSPAAMAMLKTAFNNMSVMDGGEICYTFVRYQDMLAQNAVKDDLHNITNFTLIQAGVKIGLFFEEYQDSVKISLRCRQGWRVDRLAQEWGGGGHMLAAGCTISGSLEDVMPMVLQKIANCKWQMAND